MASDYIVAMTQVKSPRPAKARGTDLSHKWLIWRGLNGDTVVLDMEHVLDNRAQNRRLDLEGLKAPERQGDEGPAVGRSVAPEGRLKPQYLDLLL